MGKRRRRTKLPGTADKSSDTQSDIKTSQRPWQVESWRACTRSSAARAPQRSFTSPSFAAYSARVLEAYTRVHSNFCRFRQFSQWLWLLFAARCG